MKENLKGIIWYPDFNPFLVLTEFCTPCQLQGKGRLKETYRDILRMDFSRPPSSAHSRLMSDLWCQQHPGNQSAWPSVEAVCT